MGSKRAAPRLVPSGRGDCAAAFQSLPRPATTPGSTGNAAVPTGSHPRRPRRDRERNRRSHQTSPASMTTYGRREYPTQSASSTLASVGIVTSKPCTAVPYGHSPPPLTLTLYHG